jgi:hypothetical protein
MSIVELLAFGLAVQLSAGAVVMINVVLSHLSQAEAERVRGE